MNYEENKYWPIFKKQKEQQYEIANSTYSQRIQKLNALKEAVEVTYKNEIREALYADFKKPYAETDLSEIYSITGEIKHVKKHLKRWMAKQRVKTPMALFGASSWYVYEPKGVCLIISPWNYPLNLTFGPLVSAIAAGNTAILKPSEMTPNISKVMKKMVEELFNENEVTLIEGEVDVSQELLKLPFNHIFFTGSPRVGKLIMKSAAVHLASVTLELGGKSPCIIDKSVNIASAAKRIMWGKFLNNGQTCIAPDYIFVEASIKNDFINACKKQLETFFTADASSSDSIGSIVNADHFKRLKAHLEEALSKQATLEVGGQHNASENYIAPTLLSNVSEECGLAKEEIFGPILPIKTYTDLSEVINYINSNEKPLALYMYSQTKKNINRVIKNTRAGSTCINNNVLQYSNHYLPFGGSNNSGIGKSHGIFGFQEFSNMRSVLKQNFTGSIEKVFPPYNDTKQKLIDLTIKWF